MLQVGMNVHIMDGLGCGLDGVIVGEFGGTKVSVKAEDGNVYMKRCHQLRKVGEPC